MGISVGTPKLSFHCRGIPSELWWMGWSRNKHHSARCKRQTQFLIFSDLLSLIANSEISEFEDWETGPSCHFRVHMSTTVITNYHALVPPKKMSRRLFNTMDACSQTASALEPLMPLERKSINSRWLSLSQAGLERNISKNNNWKRTIHV